MKKILLIICLIVLYFSGFTQDTLSINDILENVTEPPAKINEIYNLDVINYFEINDCNTPLQKKVYFQTQDYQDKLNELKELKKEILKKTYFRKGTNLFADSNYDLTKGGFYICLDHVLSDQNSVYLKGIPTKHGYCDRIFFVPANEENGLEIEKNSNPIRVSDDLDSELKESNIVVYLLFLISGVENAKYNNSKYSTDMIVSNKNRIIVANQSSGKIYFDKNYTYQKPRPKK